MTLGEISERVGVWVETAQALEQLGFFVGGGPAGFTDRDEETLRFVTRAKAEHQLPLETLRALVVVECQGDLVRAELSLAALIEPDPSRAGPGPISRTALESRLPSQAALIEALVTTGALPAEGPYGGHHVWMVETARDLMATGMPEASVLTLIAYGLSVAVVEVDALLAEVGRGALPRDALAQTRGRRVAIGRLVATARAAGAADQMATVARAADGSKALTAVAIHRPSPLFLARHRLPETLEAAQRDYERERAEGGSGTTQAAYLARLLVGLGRFAEAVEIGVDAAGRGAPTPDLWLSLGMARSMRGDDVGAIAATDSAVRLVPESPRAHAYRAAAYLVAAGRAGDLLRATVCVDLASAALVESRKWPGTSTVDRVEAALVRGRLGVVIPAPLGFMDSALDDLRFVMEVTRSATDAELGYEVAGSRDLLRVSAAFFLARALEERHERTEAAVNFREVVALDPMSDFAAAAYRSIAHRPPAIRPRGDR